MKSFFLVLFIFLALVTLAAKPRVIVLTDIGGDPDDEESMVRFLFYSNEFDIEGLIATGRVVRDDRPVLLPELIKERIKAYGEVRDKLLQHDSGYPNVEYLLDKVKTGYNIPKMMWDPKTRELTNYPLEKKIGTGNDSEGSRWIIHVVEAIRNDQSLNASFAAPVVSSPETIHVILTVKDDGKPNLYSYRRIVITVNSKFKNVKSEK